jgi:hypothetical protein
LTAYITGNKNPRQEIQIDSNRSYLKFLLIIPTDLESRTLELTIKVNKISIFVKMVINEVVHCTIKNFFI